MKLLTLLAAIPTALLAQTLEGTWQGTIAPPNQNRDLRLVLKLAKNGSGYQGMLYNIDQGGQLGLGQITLQGPALKIVVPGIGATYEGKFEQDGNTITGTFTQGQPLPLNLTRATAQTAWEIPPPPEPPKGLPEGTKLEFEVSTVKPTPAGQQGRGINVNGAEFRTRNITLAEFITFVYGLHRDQLIGLPAWANDDHWDIVAPLPPGGAPSDPQLRTMAKALMKDRFGLVLKEEKREMPVYAIAIGKAGPAGIKMVVNQSKQPLFGMSTQGPGRMNARNALMIDLANYLQNRVLDRPVIDQTGLTDRYDFMLNWTPDEFQTANDPAAAQRPPAQTGPDAPPDILTAFQEQLGLKLEATRAPATVYVVEKISRPSEN